MSLVEFAVSAREEDVFSVRDPKNPNEFLKDPSGTPYRLKAVGFQEFVLEGGDPVPPGPLKELLSEDFTEVCVGV